MYVNQFSENARCMSTSFQKKYTSFSISSTNLIFFFLITSLAAVSELNTLLLDSLNTEC